VPQKYLFVGKEYSAFYDFPGIRRALERFKKAVPVGFEIKHLGLQGLQLLKENIRHSGLRLPA
jgi:hypothetical protein